jgi:hypothetical protein
MHCTARAFHSATTLAWTVVALIAVLNATGPITRSSFVIIDSLLDADVAGWPKTAGTIGRLHGWIGGDARGAERHQESNEDRHSIGPAS